MFKTIVIATDGSEDGDRAFAMARSIAGEAASRLVVVHVIELAGGKGGVYPTAVDEDKIKAGIEEQVAQLRKTGLNAELITETSRLGAPAHIISELADAVDADLIVVGTRGRAPISEVVLGSVPVRLLHIAHRPVLVVPPLARGGRSS